MNIETWWEQETSFTMMTLTIMKYLTGGFFFFGVLLCLGEYSSYQRDRIGVLEKISTLAGATDTRDDTTTFVTSAPLQLLSGQANPFIRHYSYPHVKNSDSFCD